MIVLELNNTSHKNRRLLRPVRSQRHGKVLCSSEPNRKSRGSRFDLWDRRATRGWCSALAASDREPDPTYKNEQSIRSLKDKEMMGMNQAFVSQCCHELRGAQQIAVFRSSQRRL